jgi:5'-nucleotidase
VDDSLPVLRSAHAYGIARVIAILKPDSSRPRVEMEGFHGVDSVTDSCRAQEKVLSRRP